MERKKFKKTIIQTVAIKLFGTKGIREFLLMGGSRSGKSFIIVFAMCFIALRTPLSRQLIARFRFNHVKNSIWLDTLPKVLKLCFPGVSVKWNNTDHYIQFDNGAEIWIAGLDDKERIEKILGMEFLNIFLNEASQISYAAYNIIKTRLAQLCYAVVKDKETGEEKEVEVKRRIFIDENPPTKKHWTYRVFFENIDPISKTRLNANDYASLKMNPDQNLENIASDYLETLQSMPEAQRKRFMDGEFSDDSLDALWTSDLIGKYRIQPEDCPVLREIVVAVDPATTSDEDSDETGIIVEGVGFDDHLYVLEDLTDKVSPTEWAKISCAAYHRWQADFIVAETNQGGDMVETIIRTIDPLISYEGVHATRDKRTRAQPVASLYAQGKAHHVGDDFQELETEQTTWAGKKGDPSPNRIDALVWGAAKLLPIMGTIKKRPPKISQ